jgi:hypothetical protein
MSRFENADTKTLLIDYRANVEFLRDNPSRMANETNRQRLQELIARDVDPEEVKVDTVRLRLYAPNGYVIVNDGDKPGTAVHVGRDTCRIITHYESKWIRPATDEELASLEVCHWCMNDSGVSGLGSEPLIEPQGDSVRTVSGGGFETDRRRH